MWMSAIGILFCVSGVCAEDGAAFDMGRITFAGIEMPYRVAHFIGTGTSSVVIYLHGGSSKGDDNEMQLREPGIDSIANYLEANHLDATFLIPQCPSDKSWGGQMLGVLKALIERYAGDGAEESCRVYIFGGSMGGTGTWSMLSAYPGLFTAAMPVAGNPSKCDADKVASVPVYTVMGTSDRIMSVEAAAKFIQELDSRGATTKFDIEDGWTHEMTCIQSYTAQRLDWVFGHEKNPSDIQMLRLTDGEILSKQYFSLDGTRLSEPPAKGIYILRCMTKDRNISTMIFR